MADRYRKRLQSDLERWIAAGLIPAANRDAILNDIAPSPPRWSAQGAAAILGAVLLGLAALSFVAANWADLSKALRFATILGVLSLTYLGAGVAFARQYTALGHGLGILGAALFGAGIILTAQTFNMSSFTQTGILIWAVGALATAIAIPSRPVLILASVLGATFAGMEMSNPLTAGPVWLYAPLWIGLAATASRLGSSVSMNILGASLIAWLWHAFYEIGGSTDIALAGISAFILFTGALSILFAGLRQRTVTGAGILSAWTLSAAGLGLIGAQAELGPADAEIPSLVMIVLGLVGMAGALVGLIWQVRAGAMQARAGLALSAGAIGVLALPWIAAGVGEGAVLGLEILLGIVTYGAAVTLILVGARPGNNLTGGLGVALFVGQSIYVYQELFGDLLNTAAFFLAGGVLLIALSIGLTRWRKTIASQSEVAS